VVAVELDSVEQRIDVLAGDEVIYFDNVLFNHAILTLVALATRFYVASDPPICRQFQGLSVQCKATIFDSRHFLGGHSGHFRLLAVQ
jgi:hypothetical protein